jgi:hypothetical protein
VLLLSLGLASTLAVVALELDATGILPLFLAVVLLFAWPCPSTVDLPLP